MANSHKAEISATIDSAISAANRRQRRFLSSLMSWAPGNTRIYPWRESGRTAYELMIAELLLKRTTAAAVARLYEPFLKEYPSATHLAMATESQLAHNLTPIGLQTQRAKAIADLARHLIESNSGNVPCSPQSLSNLPGLGEYSARAILSFGCGIPAAIVDANVTRVLHRVFWALLPPRPAHSLVQFIADTLLPYDSHREYNFALLDLAAMVCRYIEPRHENCPFKLICDFYQSHGDRQPVSRLQTRLRAIRRKRKIGLVELASNAGVSKLTIINIEAGRTSPRLETLRKLATALEISEEQLKD